MDRVLRKLAKQLNQYDEASLMALWEYYAHKVSNFEPSKRWEEAVLCLGMIQSVHWKNQLFNVELAESARRGRGVDEENMRAGVIASTPFPAPKKPQLKDPDTLSDSPSSSLPGAKKRCKVLVFGGRKRRQP